MLYTSPYVNNLVTNIDKISFYLRWPAFRAIDQLLSCFIPTTVELRHPQKRLPYYLIYAPLLVIVSCLTLPIAILGWMLWFVGVHPIVLFPYKYHCNDVERSRTLGSKEMYNISTANLCLLPESVSRMNNLSHNELRARNIGESIAQLRHNMSYNESNVSFKSDVSNSEVTKDNVCNARHRIKRCNSNGNKTHEQYNKKHFADDGISTGIVTKFPIPDFLCLQEIFDGKCTELLIRELEDVFPYIVYDVRVDSWASNVYMYNSGLVIASRYPILEVEFKYFKDTRMQCRLSCKGALMTKVLLGHNDLGKSIVSFVCNTHLQEYQGRRDIHLKQLDCLSEWTDDFRRLHSGKDDVIAFDVIAGNFNFDNMSPCCQRECRHEIFEKYTDVCRVKPGLDHHWSIGTEMRHITMWDNEITSPSGLRDALIDPYTRQRYILNANIEYGTLSEITHSMPPVDEHGNYVTSPESGKRRIDLVLLRKSDNVKVTKMNWVTQLVTLTDHIPVSMTIQPTCDI